MGYFKVIFIATVLCVFGTSKALKLDTWGLEEEQVTQLSSDSVVLPQWNESLIQPKDAEGSTLPAIDLTLIQPKLVESSLTKQSQFLACGSYNLTLGQTAYIQSKNYPKNYPANDLCQWKFKSSGASSIDINCSPFNVYKVTTNCVASYLQLTGGNLFKRLCSQLDSVAEVSRADYLNVDFRTNFITASGFSCLVKANDGGSTNATAAPVNNCRCGKVNRVGRIVGGVKTEVHEYPWQVALTSPNGTRPFCGATIISDQWILTAAHCIFLASASNIRATIGEHNWNSTSETSVTERKGISQIVVHPYYNSRTQDNDMALLKLTTPIAFPSNNKIAPVCLPPARKQYENVNATVTGWGTLALQGSRPYELYEVTMPTMPNSKCQTNYGYAITGNMICAGLATGGKDSCQGDSGGPMVTTGGNGTFMEIIGVVSWGSGCALANYPGVYSRVNTYLNWISTTTAGSRYCPAA